MSLSIKISTVQSVLLAGTWYDVYDASFDLDSYEFLDDDHPVHKGGNSQVSATGFRFRTMSGATLYGPITAIQAVSNRPMGTTRRSNDQKKKR